MIQYDARLDAELQDLIAKNPKNYIKVLKSVGARKRCIDRQYLYDYILRTTPLLDSNKYTLKTRLYWTLNHIQDWNDPKVRCKNPGCDVENGRPFIDKNIKKLKDGYVMCCCKKCERQYAQHSLKANMQKKYGVDNPFQLESIKRKISLKQDAINQKKNKTHKEHNTFKTSKVEDDAYQLLIQKFKYVARNYSCPEYPFNCDFFIPSLKLFIELNGTWTHGGRFFDNNDHTCIEQLEKWRKLAEKSDFYKNAIQTWTERDVLKRNIALKNNLNYKVFWNIEELKTWLSEMPNFDQELFIEWNNHEANYEKKLFLSYKKLDIDKIPRHNNHNFLVKYFQQDVFYKTEKELWKDNSIRQKLLDNRSKFLDKNIEDLTSIELLDGFKKSGIHYGYSHFNPLIFRWFVQKYNAKICYDPCGGWGHRLLGAKDLDLYLYNDLSKSVKQNVDKLISFLKIDNVKTTCFDARQYCPTEEFDAMFTCPPYFNLEHYECRDFKNEEEFTQFIDQLFVIFNKKQSCRLFGIVLREDLIYSHSDFYEKFQITVEKENYLINKSKKNLEYLYIFKK